MFTQLTMLILYHLYLYSFITTVRDVRSDTRYLKLVNYSGFFRVQVPVFAKMNRVSHI